MEIKDLLDVPTGDRKIVNAAMSGAHFLGGKIVHHNLARLCRAEIDYLENLHKHMVFDEALHFPNVGTPGHIDHGSHQITGRTDYKDHGSLIAIDSLGGINPLDLATINGETIPNLYTRQIKIGKKKRDKNKIKNQKKARKINRR